MHGCVSVLNEQDKLVYFAGLVQENVAIHSAGAGLVRVADFVLSGVDGRRAFGPDRLVQHARAHCWRRSRRWSTSRASKSIVVDNASRDGSADAVAERFPICSADPLGRRISASRRA